MLALAFELDVLAALGDVVERVPVLAQRSAMLIEIGGLQARARGDFPALRLQLAEQELQKCTFPGAVRSDDADTVAAHDRRREIAQDHAIRAGCVAPCIVDML